MNIRDPNRSTAAPMQTFALLRLDGTRLLMPQRELRVLDLVMDVARDNPPPGGVGWIEFRHQRCPVYAPSSRLEWQIDIPAERSICALLEVDEGIFGLLCSEVAMVKSQELTFHPIPAAMATPHSPITQLALYEGDLVCLTSAKRLFTRLPTLDDRPTPYRNTP